MTRFTTASFSLFMRQPHHRHREPRWPSRHGMPHRSSYPNNMQELGDALDLFDAGGFLRFYLGMLAGMDYYGEPPILPALPGLFPWTRREDSNL